MNQITEAIHGVHVVENYMKHNTSATHPKSIKEVAESLAGRTKNAQQVTDTIKRLYSTGSLSRIRIDNPGHKGLCYGYWWRSENEPVQTVSKPKENISIAVPKETPVKSLPEIKVTKTGVVITNSQIRITVEF